MNNLFFIFLKNCRTLMMRDEKIKMSTEINRALNEFILLFTEKFFYLLLFTLPRLQCMMN